MRAIWTIGAKDLRQRLRDRSAIILAFIAPILLAGIISATFGSFDDDDFALQTTLVVVDNDRSQLSSVFADQVLGADVFGDSITVIRADDTAQAKELIGRDEADAGFVIPGGFERDVQSALEAEIVVLRTARAQLSGSLAEALAAGFTDQVNASRLSVLTAVRVGGGDGDRIAELAAMAARERMPVRLVDEGVGSQEVTGASYFGPAMAIFFLFFTVGWGARSLLVERRQGTLARLLAAPVSRGGVIAGKAVAAFVLGVASMATMFAFMSLALGASPGDLPSVAALTLVTVLAVMGVTALVGTFAKTDDQADSYASMVAVTLAIIGGNFFPLFQLPPLMQRLSLATPNGWAIRGFTDLAYDGAGLAQIAPNLAAVGAFAAVTMVLVALRAKRLAVQ